MKRHNDQKISEVLKEIMNSKRLKPKLNQNKVKSLWETMMGPSINKYTKKLSDRRNKLYVTIESAPVKQDLAFGKEKIKKMINEELGEE